MNFVISKLKYLFFRLILAPLTMLVLFMWTSYMSILAIFLAKTKWENQHIEKWAKGVIKLCRCKIQVRGLENIPNHAHLILFNHLSLLDIPILYYALGGYARFGAKSELFKVPIFGFALKRFGFLRIERNNREKTIKTYEKTKQEFAKGKSFFLAPEGTRQKQVEIGEFKSGPFILAIRHQVTVLPVVSCGQEKIVPKGRLIPDISKKHLVRIMILPQVNTNDFTYEKRADLKNIVRKKMMQALEEIKKESP